MSRRKDRDRFSEMKRLNPNYQGFRGYGQDPTKAGDTPLEMVTCSVCDRRRNVALDTALEQGGEYVCLSCREDSEEEAQEEGVGGLSPPTANGNGAADRPGSRTPP